jgi:RNA-directed DNA polymerase
MFANLYLNEFDHFVLKNITPHYFRYLDDMVFVIPKSKSIKNILKILDEFLLTLNLKLNPSKTKHNFVNSGVNLTGFIVKPFSLYIRNSTKYRAKRALKKEAINSYYGLMGQANCYNLRVSIAKRNNFTMFYYQKLI